MWAYLAPRSTLMAAWNTSVMAGKAQEGVDQDMFRGTEQDWGIPGVSQC